MADLYTQLALVVVGISVAGVIAWALLSRRHARRDHHEALKQHAQYVARIRIVPVPPDGPPAMRVHPDDSTGRHHITDSERSST